MAHEFIKHLKKDHDEQKDLAKKLAEATDPAQRTQLRQKFWESLYPHIIGEEHSVFPVLKGAKEEETREQAYEALEEHAGAKHALAGLMACDPKAPEFKAKVKVLDEMNHHHIEEEEGESFPALEKMCDKKKLDELYKQYEAAEEKAKKEKPKA